MLGVISGEAGVSTDSFEFPVVQIPKNPEVKVRITSGTAHTKEGKREMMQNLRAMGAISNRTLLEAYDIDPEEEELRIQEEIAAMQPQNQEMDPNAPLPEGMQMEDRIGDYR